MRKSLLCLALVLGLTSVAWAHPTHEAQYIWMYDPTLGVEQPFGTIVDQYWPTDETWTIGYVSPSSRSVAQVREKFWAYEERGLGMFSWTVWNDEPPPLLGRPLIIPGTIDSFHIRSYGYEPIPYDWDNDPLTSDTIADSPAGWGFDTFDGYYVWYREEGAGIGPGASLNNMQVIVPTTLWSISNGGVDWRVDGPLTDVNDGNNDGDHERWVLEDGNGYWRASHPGVPEPSSMLLLGMGLFGFAGKSLRKRFKA